MSNSKLATYTAISPNRNAPRNHKIDTITIHCMAAQWTASQCANYFEKSSVKASSNYCVGYDGSVALSVPESDRSWCSSSAINDNRAITIEVASDSSAPFAVRSAAYTALIALLADICKRNGIKKLVWDTHSNNRVNRIGGTNMTVHMDFANKACPGEWLLSRMGQIAEEVNEKMEEDNMPRWNKLNDIPEGFYRNEAKTLMDRGILKGDANGNLDITKDMLRCMIFCQRIVDGKFVEEGK